MNLLRKENWLVCLILSILSQGIFPIVLGYFMKVFDKKAWYTKWQYWVFGTLCLFFPVLVMLYVFVIQITCKVALELKTPGKEIYYNPYVWILCLIIPVIGWILLIVMYLYVLIWPSVMIKRGNGEEFLKCL